MGRSSSNDLFCLLCTVVGAAAGVSLYRLGCRRRQENERRRVEAAVEELEERKLEALRADYLALMDDALAALSAAAEPTNLS
uniref:Uncharacterized protein n=1 Tax=Leersia perrieri TaxID=77586 RepID=A0A0D9W418_9ORYZ